ncbi:hypothetical protein [Peteryoungia ipomoeae]|uniref:Uncharacterized protein n=1 Tax=Peteryoungia ipomoeae TaxID=1210932 RepID=A0A4V4HMZ7_9HYPH|nr:hypothetical protein [Peteryoungia ipomoeae]THV24136.1 hypothetical protein FAA97_09225 [Peteryoungia ipomoeae]
MRFAIDTVDDAGADRIYIGTPIRLRDHRLTLRLRDGEVSIDTSKIIDWFQIDRSTTRERADLFDCVSG